jgi:hypothetical protein
MKIKEDAIRRRRLANNPAVHAEMRWYLKQLNAALGQNTFGTTTTTTSTTSTTTSTTTS